MNYGQSIIEHQKKLGDYGDIFEYEDYQKLKLCQSKDEFINWLKGSKYKNSKVLNNIETTYEYLVYESRIVILENHRRNSWKFASLSILDILYLPFALLTYLSSYIEIKKLKRKQMRLSNNVSDSQ